MTFFMTHGFEKLEASLTHDDQGMDGTRLQEAGHVLHQAKSFCGGFGFWLHGGSGRLPSAI